MSWRPDLPGVLGEIAEAAGEAAAIKLCVARGGREIEIPVRPAGSQMASIIGVTATEAVKDRLGPGRLRLPAGGYVGEAGRRRRGMELLEAGWSNARVAEACDVTLRAVEKWRAALRRREAADQLGLPFEG